MTLPADCDVCGHPLFPWDEDEVTPCTNCGSRVKPWEMLTLPESIRRSRLIARREEWGRELDRAARVEVREDVL